MSTTDSIPVIKVLFCLHSGMDAMDVSNHLFTYHLYLPYIRNDGFLKLALSKYILKDVYDPFLANSCFNHICTFLLILPQFVGPLEVLTHAKHNVNDDSESSHRDH